MKKVVRGKAQRTRLKRVQPARTRFQLPLYFGWQVVLERIADVRSQIVGPFRSYRAFITVVAVLVVLTSTVLFVAHAPNIRAATYQWLQTTWDASPSATNAAHPGDATGWSAYSAKDSTVTTGATLTLGEAAQVFTETTDTNFNAGTHSGTATNGTGTNGSVRLTASLAGSPAETDISMGSSLGADDYAYDTVNNALWFANSTSSNIYRVPFDGSGLVAYDIGFQSSRIAFDSLTNSLWVLRSSATTTDLYQVSPTNGTVIHSYDVMTSTTFSGIVFDPATNYLWVSGSGKKLYAIDTNGVVQQTCTLTGTPGRLVVDSSTNTIWAVDSSAHAAIKVNKDCTGEQSFATGKTTEAFITFDSLSPAVWLNASGFSNDGLLKFDTSTGSRSTYTPVFFPYGLAYDSDQNVIWVWSGGDNKLHKISRTGTDLASYTLTNNLNSGTPLLYEPNSRTLWGRGLNDKFSKFSFYTYGASGTFTSQVLDTGGSSSYGTATWSDYVPATTTLTVKVRTSTSATMIGAPDWSTCSTVTKDADLSSNSCVHDGQRYVQYQASLASSTNTLSPALSSITINYGKYTTGTLTSSAYNTGDATNVVGGLQWTESLPSGTDIRFQIRTAPNNGGVPGTWTSFLGPTGTGDYYTNPAGGEAINPTHTTGGDDQWVQYKVWLESTAGTVTSTLSDVTLSYVVNAPPQFQTAPTASQASDGTVTISFSVRDPDTTSGSYTRGYVTPSYEVSLNNGSSWSPITTGLPAGATNPIAVQEVAYAPTSIVWNAKAQLNGTYAAQAKVRVTVDDSEIANHSAVSASGAFTLDVKNPTLGSPSVTVDATTAPAAIGMSATDDSAITACVTLDNTQTNCIPYASTTTLALATDPDTVYVIYRDAYGNTSSANAVSPQTPTSIIIRDISNTVTGNYRMFVSWGAVSTPLSDFAAYDVWHSVGGGSYTLLESITDRAKNYTVHEGLVLDSDHAYKVVTRQTDGSKSYYSSSVHDTANGQGGSDSTAPTITGVSITSISTQSAVIQWDTDELSNSTVAFSATPGNYANVVGVSTMTDTAAGVGRHQVTLTGLTPATPYYLVVRSKDPTGNEATDTHGGAGYTFSTLSGPTISTVTPTTIANTVVTISWKTNIPAPSTVLYSPNATLTGATEVTTDTEVTDHAVTLTGLTLGTKYYFEVRSGVARDTNGGAYYTFTTTSDQTAPVISSVQASPVTDTQAVVQWVTNESASGQVAYGVSVSALTTQTTLDSSLNIIHTATLSNLQSDTQYHFTVTSVDASGNTSTSPVTSFTTKEKLSTESEVKKREDDARRGVVDTTAAIISNVGTKDLTSNEATILWTTNEVTNGFVEYGSTNGYGTVYGNWLSSTDHAITLQQLLPNTTYHFRAISVDVGGNITMSDDRTVTTKPATQASLTDINSELLGLISDLKGSVNVDILESTLQQQVALIDELSAILPTPIITGTPHVTTTPTTAVVEWITDKASTSQLAYAADGKYRPTEKEPYETIVGETATLTTKHRITLTNLAPKTTYHYQIRSKTEVSKTTTSRDLTFVTDPETFAIDNYAVEKVADDQAVFRWVTNRTASAAVRLIPYRNNVRSVADLTTVTSPNRGTIHQVTVSSLETGVRYDVELVSTDQSGTVATKTVDAFSTSNEATPPEISQIQVNAALSPGEKVKVQTIISWNTNVNATSLVRFRRGVGRADETLTDATPLSTEYTKKHVVVITNFEPGSVYQVRVESTDASGRVTVSKPLTILTPQQQQTVVQVILKAVEKRFGWAKLFQ